LTTRRSEFRCDRATVAGGAARQRPGRGAGRAPSPVARPRGSRARRDLFAVLTERVAADGYYELTRNWRIGTALAESLQIPGFLLINLGPPEKIEVDADIFMTLLARSPLREFASCSWSDILEAAKPLEAWLDRYASERQRLLY
jgi:hypothetical protein